MTETAEFVEERRALLDRFLKEIGNKSYIIRSHEFKIFARSEGEIEKMLIAIPK